MSGWISVLKGWRDEFPVRESFLPERGSGSLKDLVGDLDDFLVDERGDRSGVLELDLESELDFFLVGDLEKKVGNTMELTMAPGNTCGLSGLTKWLIPA